MPNRKRKNKKRTKPKNDNNYRLNTINYKIINGFIRIHCDNIFVPEVLIVKISLFCTFIANIYDHHFKHLVNDSHNIIKMFINTKSLYFISMNSDLYVYGNTKNYELGLQYNEKINNAVKHEYFSNNDVKLISHTLKAQDTYIYTKDNQLFRLGLHSNKIIKDKDGQFLFRGIIQSINSFRSDIMQIESGYNYTLFLDSKGNVYGVGCNIKRQMDVRPHQDRLHFIQILNQNKYNNIKYIGCCKDKSFMLNNKGTLYGCGTGYPGSSPFCEYKNILKV